MSKRVLSRCLHADPTSPTTRCNGTVYVDGTKSGGCGCNCRFMRLKAGEGYPPLPSPQEQQLVRALDDAMLLTNEAELRKEFRRETGYNHPDLPDEKYSENVRRRAFQAFIDRKRRSASMVLDDYLPDDSQLAIPQLGARG